MRERVLMISFNQQAPTPHASAKAMIFSNQIAPTLHASATLKISFNQNTPTPGASKRTHPKTCKACSTLSPNQLQLTHTN